MVSFLFICLSPWEHKCLADTLYIPPQSKLSTQLQLYLETLPSFRRLCDGGSALHLSTTPPPVYRQHPLMLAKGHCLSYNLLHFKITISHFCQMISISTDVVWFLLPLRKFLATQNLPSSIFPSLYHYVSVAFHTWFSWKFAFTSVVSLFSLNLILPYSAFTAVP